MNLLTEGLQQLFDPFYHLLPTQFLSEFSDIVLKLLFLPTFVKADDLFVL